MPNSGRSADESSARFLINSYTVATIRVGMARKNENSVAALRVRPNIIEPMMVAPERLVPGMSATAWAQPTLKASSMVMSSISWIRTATGLLFWRPSTHRMTKPPMMNDSATGTGWNRADLIMLPKMRPSTASGMKAIITLTRNFCCFGSLNMPRITASMRTWNSQHTARMAPDWITILKTFDFSSVKSSRLPARIR